MARDKRTKGCPNTECSRNQNKYHYKVSDRYCTICGCELVLVCPDCFQKLADLGPLHTRCNSCLAEREDRRHRPGKRIRHIAGEATEFTKATAQHTKDFGVGVVEGIKDLAQQVREMADKSEEKPNDEHSI